MTDTRCLTCGQPQSADGCNDPFHASGVRLGPRLDILVTAAISTALDAEAAHRNMSRSDVARQALTLGLRQLGHQVTYS